MNIDINNPSRKYRVIYADPAGKCGNRNTGGSMTSSAESSSNNSIVLKFVLLLYKRTFFVRPGL